MELNGEQISLVQLAAVASGGEAVHISDRARPRILASRKLIEQIIERDAVVYGVNTGFGKLADVRIGRHELRQLQLNLVRSHACGIGNRLSEPEVRAMMLLRANVLALGLSGVRCEVIELLCEMLNRRIYPVVPEKGSVGASGDLAPLSHLALSLVGEGEALNYVFGYATGNDFSARDLQLRDGRQGSQFMIGKTPDGFMPIGPYLVGAEIVGDPQNLAIECRVNGERRQSSNTSDMIFSVAKIIAYASSIFTLKPGDVFSTGTPEGVILGKPEAEQVWLKAGDEVACSVEKLGELRFQLA